ncbi:MAG: hypothetical protein IT374_11845 [Polyangiaceae bacterium]|nr:hypothetical protein [Polyangiaceae bacterium]
MSSVWHRSLVWLASALVAAVALLVPRAALAAGPSCDARAASIAPDVVAMCVALTQAGVELPEEVAGLCDPSGASAVAPPPSMPIESGTIGAADDCDGPAARGAAVTSPAKSKTSREASTQHDAATLGDTALRVAPSAALTLSLGEGAAPRSRGFREAVERPPRR